MEATILRLLEGEPLRQVSAQLTDGDLTCFRLVSTAFRAHAAPPQKRTRSAFMRSAALVAFAWAALPGFRDGDTPLLALAAGIGEVEALAWLRFAAGSAWHEDAPAHAASEGRLEALVWLREHGCPWDERSVWLRAVDAGHVEVLAWAREEGGCSWAANTCSRALKRGHLNVVRWAEEERGCSCSLHPIDEYLSERRHWSV